MNVDIYEKYYNYKLKTIYQYSLLLSKILGVDNNKLWHRKRELEESMKEIINNYISREKSNNDLEKNMVWCFITDKEISKYNIDRELMSVIDYFITKQRAFEIKAYEKEIILAGVILHVANGIDVMTSPYSSNKNNYKTVIHSYINKFIRLDYINMIDEMGTTVKILQESVRTNIRKEHRLFEMLNSNNSFNKYVDISYENTHYLIQYNYSVPGIKTLEKGAVEYIYRKDNIDNKFTLISGDLAVVTLMKLTSVRKFNKVFYLPIKDNFLESDSDLNKLSSISKIDYLSKHLKMLINYKDATEKNIEKLNKRSINYVIYCNKNTVIVDPSKDLDNGEYLVSKDFYDANTDIVDRKIKEKNNIIIEAFEGMVSDRIIAEEG